MDKNIVEKWKDKIRETIFSPNYVGSEVMGDLQVAISYAQILNKEVYLFGTQNNMDCFTKFFLHEGLHVKAIVDRTGKKWGGGIRRSCSFPF